jgi:hypothetical protein
VRSVAGEEESHDWALCAIGVTGIVFGWTVEHGSIYILRDLVLSLECTNDSCLDFSQTGPKANE